MTSSWSISSNSSLNLFQILLTHRRIASPNYCMCGVWQCIHGYSQVLKTRQCLSCKLFHYANSSPCHFSLLWSFYFTWLNAQWTLVDFKALFDFIMYGFGIVLPSAVASSPRLSSVITDGFVFYTITSLKMKGLIWDL